MFEADDEKEDLFVVITLFAAAFTVQDLEFILIQDHHISVGDNTVEGKRFTPEIAGLSYEQHRSNTFDSLDHYNSFQRSVHIVTPGRQCRRYQHGRELKCPHEIAISMLVNRIHVPDVSKSVRIGTRRQSGRPLKALDRYKIRDYSIDQKGKKYKVKGTKRKVGDFIVPEMSKNTSFPVGDDVCEELDPALMNSITPISQEKSASHILVPSFLESIPMQSLAVLDLLSLRYLPLDSKELDRVNLALVKDNHELEDMHSNKVSWNPIQLRGVVSFTSQ
jgi:hypothetical protein